MKIGKKRNSCLLSFFRLNKKIYINCSLFGEHRTKKIMDLGNVKMAGMEIIVLGTGCAKCKSLEKVTKQAVEELNLDATVSKEEDIQKIMEYGVMSTPGLVVNGKVVLSGKLPKLNDVKELLTQNQ